MKLGEAMTFVLRDKGPNLIQNFWKEDLASLVGGVLRDAAGTFRDGKSKWRNFSLREAPGKIAGAVAEVYHVTRVMPGRIKFGLTEFQSEMADELDTKSDSREKALFCLQVIGILSSSTLSTYSNLRSPGKSFSIRRLKIRSAAAQFVLAELLLRSLKLFLHRFLKELEKEITDEDDLNHVRYFIRLLKDGNIPEETPQGPGAEAAFRITENLKKNILNGDDET